MKARDFLLAISLTSTLVLVGARLQEASVRPSANVQPERALLRRLVGEWDVKSIYKIPEEGSFEETARETVELCCGDKWLLVHQQGKVLGAPFESHTILGFDPGKGRYVSVRVDSQLPTLQLAEGRWDEASSTLSMFAEVTDGRSGRKIPTRSVTRIVDEDHRVLEVSVPGADGEVHTAIETRYERRD